MTSQVKDKKSTLLNSLVQGLDYASKKELAEKIGITVTHLNRMVKNPGRIYIDQARGLVAYLEPIYGEEAVMNAIALKPVCHE